MTHPDYTSHQNARIAASKQKAIALLQKVKTENDCQAYLDALEELGTLQLYLNLPNQYSPLKV